VVLNKRTEEAMLQEDGNVVLEMDNNGSAEASPAQAKSEARN
jgi:hypothetical protein